MEDLFVIVGLGNPGAKYENTRHNVGFDTVELLSRRHDIKLTKLKHKALIGDGNIGGRKVILAKPQTFMNLSGESVREIVEWYKIPVKNIIIVYDDIDLPVGKLRLRPKGSAGTHNGMKSVIYQIQSDEFPRVRIGVDKPPEGWDLANYVLGRFSGDERKKIEDTIERAADAVEAIVKSGIDSAMNRYNK
ncbi:peptidyl-tRNA hydrolase [Acetivibrio straminisolvens JCM 21531]|uniref:Peptidyl-tRNA hydrolase n=1 Tax=Acetivibrio straminisolvens JCM 21531 TaxID=1294263 RepID=W4V283_9FIRM|nr:aminoacyl-tRNA hydrolase [Acetivibrio straminisolvens]GAE87237.1 peptidyl-tRNA hydrolase [Acetivibrio straminisolvens JCM 21531]